jgi:hypothetical protein
MTCSWSLRVTASRASIALSNRVMATISWRWKATKPGQERKTGRLRKGGGGLLDGQDDAAVVLAEDIGLGRVRERLLIKPL